MTNCKVYSYPINNVNSISFSLLCLKGAMLEKDNEKGITHLIEHLCFRKAGEWTQSQIYCLAESNGVNVFGKTGKNYVEISFSCRPEVFNDMVKLVSKMWFELDYSQQDLDDEKRVVCNEIAIKESTNTDVILGNLWQNSLLDCNVLGTEQSVQSITLEQVVNYKKTMLSANTAIVVAGNFTDSHLQCVESEIVGRFVAVDNDETEFVERKNTEEKFVLVKDKFPMVDVYYSFHTSIGCNTEKYVAILALDDILFKGNAGYVVENLRDKFGFIYEIESTVEIVDGEVGWVAKLTCHKQNVVEVVACLEKLLQDFSPSGCYLQYVKAFYCDNLPLLLDNPTTTCNCVTHSIVATKQVVTLQDFAKLCQAPNVALYKQMLSELLASRRVYVFGNVSRQSAKALNKLL